jgi:hypothetical protein
VIEWLIPVLSSETTDILETLVKYGVMPLIEKAVVPPLAVIVVCWLY